MKRERCEELISLPHSGQYFAVRAERGLGKCGLKGAGCGPGLKIEGYAFYQQYFFRHVLRENQEIFRGLKIFIKKF